MSVGISRYIRELGRAPGSLSVSRFQDGEFCLVARVGSGWRLGGAD